MRRRAAVRSGTAIACGVALGALAAPGAASAATYCVSKPACVTAGGAARPDVQAALTSATAAGDRVEIGAGTFTAPAGGFAVGPSGNALTIVGAGSGAGGTVLTRPPVVKAAGYQAGTVLGLEGRPTDLSGVAIVLPKITDGGAAYAETFGVGANGTTRLHDIAVRTAAGYAATPAAGAIGVTLRGSAVLAGSTVDLSTATTAKAVTISDATTPAAPATIEDSTLLSTNAGVQLDKSSAAIRRSTILAPASPVNQFGGDLVVESSVLRGSSRVLGNVGSGAATATLDNVTIASPTATAASGSALQVWADGAAASITLRSSIVGGFDTAVDRRSTAADPSTAILRQNDLTTPSGVVPSGSMTGSTTNTGAVSVDPAFVDAAAGDFRLTAGSPVLDQGVDPAPAGLGPDRAGAARVVDGNGDGAARLDLGAYERAAPPVVPATPVVPVVPGPLAPVVPPAGTPVVPTPSVVRPGFATASRVAVRAASGRVKRSRPVRLVLRNTNAFAITTRVTATTTRKRGKAIRWSSVAANVPKAGSRTVSLRVPAAARAILRRTGRLVLRVRVVAKAPDGGTRTIRRTVRVSLRR